MASLLNLGNIMRKILFLSLIMLLLISHVHADTEVRPTITVSYAVEPQALMPGDTGTVTVELKNMAVTSDVYIKEEDKTFRMNAYVASVNLGGTTDIKVLDGAQTNLGLLGPGDYTKVTFNIQADKNISDGLHYLTLEVVGGSNMYSLTYRIPIKIDSRNVNLIVSDMPSTAMQEYSILNVNVVNLRPNEIKSVIVQPSGSDITFTPSSAFVGTIAGGNNSTAKLTLNTVSSSIGNKNLQLYATYYNGDNLHKSNIANYTLDVVNRSSLILSGIELTGMGTYNVKGSINNFGTTDAKNVMLSVIDTKNVTPIEPKGKYFVGTLGSDDESSFELSASVINDASSIPVLIEFRNSNNAYTAIKQNISLGSMYSNTNSNSSVNSGLVSFFIFASIALLAAGVGWLIFKSWKKHKKVE